MYRKHGNLNSPFTKLDDFLVSSFSFDLVNDFAKIRRNSFGCRIFDKRCVISSAAELELAHTRTKFDEVCTISSMAATNVLVLPVP